MTTDRLLQIVKLRGLEIYLREDGSPFIHGPREMVTDKLLSVIKLPYHREEIIRRLSNANSDALPCDFR